MRPHHLKSYLVAVVTACAISTWAPLASASPPSTDDLLRHTPQAISEEAVPLEPKGLTGHYTNADRTVELRGTPSRELILNANQPDAVAVDIPVDGDTEPKALEDNLGATWRRPDGVELASLVDADGGTQVNIINPHSGAAREYEFEFSLPSDARSLKTANGGVLFLDAAGELLVGIAPPWALDAAGNPVPTRFEISGHKVTQIVDFTEDTTFPVVADPYLGKNLFSSIGYKYGKYYGRNTYVVTLNLSKWGWATYSGVNVPGGPAGGQAILNTLGWSEALARGGQVKKLLLSKPSMRQQFSCHALGAPGAGTWELEQFRVNRTRTWAYGVAVHHCNWTTANRY